MNIRKFEHVEEGYRKGDKGVIPTRGTRRSAGYDFYSTREVIIEPKETITIWSNIKARMYPNEVLTLHVRSSVGINYGLAIACGTGIIDSDYYGNKKNDGNIGIPLYNYSNKPVKIKLGDRIAQGIFLGYRTVPDDEVLQDERVGGIGSSGK